jgi:hypothetical protein
MERIRFPFEASTNLIIVLELKINILPKFKKKKKEKKEEEWFIIKNLVGAVKEKKIRDVLSKRREDLNLDLDLLSSPLKIAVLGVFSVSSTGLRFWWVALDLIFRSRSRFGLFNIKSYCLLQRRRVFDSDQKIAQSSSVTANDHTKPVNDRTKPANDRRTCAKTSKPSVEETDEGRSTA